MRIRGIAGDPDRRRHELVGDRGHRAIENFGEAVIRMQFLPHPRRRDPAGKSVDEDHLLAHIEPALQHFLLHALQLGIAFEHGFEAGRILFPQCLPDSERLFGCVVLALARGLRFAGVAARELSVQKAHRLAEHLGDARPLTRRKFRLRQPFQLPEHDAVELGNVRERERAHPGRTAVCVGKGERAQVAARLRQGEFVHPMQPLRCWPLWR